MSVKGKAGPEDPLQRGADRRAPRNIVDEARQRRGDVVAEASPERRPGASPEALGIGVQPYVGAVRDLGQLQLQEARLDESRQIRIRQ